MTAGALDELVEKRSRRDPAIDSPNEYRNLSHHERGQLQAWIKENIGPRKTPNSRTSYGLKHVFEESADGCYTTNGQFKGAMLASGYRPVDAHALNWTFRISTKGVPYAGRSGSRLRGCPTHESFNHGLTVYTKASERS